MEIELAPKVIVRMSRRVLAKASVSAFHSQTNEPRPFTTVYIQEILKLMEMESEIKTAEIIVSVLVWA